MQKVFLLITGFLLMSAQAWTAPLRDLAEYKTHYLAEQLKARNLQEFEKSQSTFIQLTSQWTACKQQMQEPTLWSSCHVLLQQYASQLKWSPAEQKRFLSDLNENCDKYIENLSAARANALETSSVIPECRARLTAKKEEIGYAQNTRFHK